MNFNRVVVGWFTLIVLYTVIQDKTASKVATGLNGVTGVIRRLSDPTVALIPNYSKAPLPSTPAKTQNSAVATAPGVTVIPNASASRSTGTVNV